MKEEYLILCKSMYCENPVKKEGNRCDECKQEIADYRADADREEKKLNLRDGKDKRF